MSEDIKVKKHDIIFRRQRNRLYTLKIWQEVLLYLAVINKDISAYDKSPIEFFLSVKISKAPKS